ncbi:MAG: hypothetical protein F4160_05265 [Rhodospirillaceae bacterium]|nr:hypothetical protein [Rhodospirillaceae bacterium]MYH36193.1 hypothetical protein [Rhodospirillaceae bacterium]MYK16181.1 hypothetical protein [Rhodospirillaceae bacterium]
MNNFQEGGYGKPGPAELPMAEVVRISGSPKGSPTLELRVNIEGRDRRFLLTLSALEGHGLSGPAAVEELRAIRAALEKIAEALTRNPETE